jgi:ribonuclease III
LSRAHNPQAADEATIAVEEKLGYRFKDKGLLARALTHASATGAGLADNERLEFLGDRVLALVAADALLVRFPEATEGALAPRLNALVRAEACAAAARSLELEPHIRAGRAALNTAILADACEALMAAVYLDGGLEAARGVFAHAWASLLDSVAVAPIDAKSALQEWSQGLSLGLPNYTLLGREGPDHAPVFRVGVAVVSRATVEGEGPNKRAAEQAAAAAFLVREGVWSSEEGERALRQQAS